VFYVEKNKGDCFVMRDTKHDNPASHKDVARAWAEISSLNAVARA
jgi:hypothetical protein